MRGDDDTTTGSVYDLLREIRADVKTLRSDVQSLLLWRAYTRGGLALLGVLALLGATASVAFR